MEINLEHSDENFETWSQRDYLSEELKQSVLNSDILIVPLERFRDEEQPIFPQRTAELFNFVKENTPLETNVEVCIDEEDYKELALYDDSINIGFFVITTVVLPFFISLLANFISNKIYLKEQKQQIRFTFTVVDETESKTLTFEGNIAEFLSATEEIKNLCLEKPKTLNLQETISEVSKPKSQEVVKKPTKPKRS